MNMLLENIHFICRLKIKIIRSTFYFIFFIVIVFTILKFISNLKNNSSINNKIQVNDNLEKLSHPFFHSVNLPNENRILIVTTSLKQKQITQFTKSIQWSRFKFNFFILKSTHDRHNLFNNLKLNNRFTCFYSLILFESIELFESIKNEYFMNYLIKTANKFKIGFVFLDSKPNYDVEYCKLNPFVGKFFKTTKFNSEENFLLKKYSNSGHQYIEENIKNTIPILLCDSNKNAILMDDGSGLRYIIMKIRLENILSSLLLDILEYCSYGRLSLDLERMIQIDIDDIFVGASGLRLKPRDVNALIEFQYYLNENIFKESIEKFKFNLGFSGFHFLSGNDDENHGDRLLIEKKNSFNWFDHTWSHFKSQHLNLSQMKEQFYFNFNFAQEFNLPTDTFYSVSPHHSGIYPTSNKLFELWSKIWMIKVTSTEEYPHLRPSHLRRGFVYKNIMVLPRQTCGIFTHTNFFKSYPGGIQSLLTKMYGGEIFQTVLFNRINIFMTHMTNFANDQLGIYLFKNLFKFFSQKTNIKFIFKSPIKLANDYFNLYTNEIEPIWTNPCTDKHHMAIWSFNLTCMKFPKLIILGPQKTGTTAMHHFLNVHPQFSSSQNTRNHFEETQFFATEYHNGIEWYLSLFDSNESIINFEKSANYFSNVKTPFRIRKLLPNVKFIIIFIDPIDRAYSWYHHMKAHNDPVATRYTFFEILTLSSNNKSSSRMIKALREKCLDPGIYIKHLLNWFRFFKRNQFLIVDGDELKQRPYSVMNSIQLYMNSSEFYDYKNLLVFDPRKKFYCLKNRHGKKRRCLGPGKGRIYKKIDQNSYSYLKNFYQKYNIQLLNFLNKNLFNLPKWLKNYID